ncbi:uncharacterized protein N7482_010665 [Penicillium canariense]|uniref:Transcription factor domain-containing protein n=1 Tax=Penicillium canariense TaxID=189055 RepID=A0A9W9HK85_9EURO|nr:uncharacterized protein N7482_010665 [Penicillium canariense]KAJ5151413.1 hypothetical protein N7482_010665 [Penicillium canariense]
MASPHGSGMSHDTTASGTSHMAMVSTSAEVLPPMTIPLWHSTTTGSLLSCPQVKSLLGDYPSDVFLRIEERRAPLTSQGLVGNPTDLSAIQPLDRSCTDDLMELYFQTVNIQHPILDRDECIALYHSTVSRPLQPSLESALLLVVLALAECAKTQPPERLSADWAPGSTYFLPGLSISLEAYLNTTVPSSTLPQCLYLMALYYNYIVRPLDAWKLVHMASTCFQRLWISDLIAEHHLPRSGIENLVDRLQLPLCGDPPNPSLLAWLAELSARRLLNRVHHAMYENDQEHLLQADHVTSNCASGREEEVIIRLMSSRLNVSMELDTQLNHWYDLIPQIIKPDLTQIPISVGDAVIVLRHHSAKDIIFRPFLLFACSLPSTVRPPESLIEICQTTIYSCRQYVRAAAMRLAEPSASTEIVVHSVFASTIIITISALNPWLTEYAPDIDDLQGIAISTMQRWALPGSCIEAMTLMLGAIRNKTKMLKANSELI